MLLDRKIQICKSINRPIDTFECDVWTIVAVEHNLLNTWKRKVLRKIYVEKNLNTELEEERKI